MPRRRLRGRDAAPDGAVATLYAAEQATWNPAWQLTVSSNSLRPGGMAKRPYVAVWIEDKDRFPVRTVALWYDGKARYLPEMRAWSRADRLRAMADGSQIVDAVTSPTRQAGRYTLQWDGKDNSRQAGKGRHLHRLHRSVARARQLSDHPAADGLLGVRRSMSRCQEGRRSVPQASTISRQTVGEIPRRQTASRRTHRRVADPRGVAPPRRQGARWLHIYGSMVSLALVLFFAITGDHAQSPGLVRRAGRTEERHGSMTAAWLSGGREGVDKLRVVEYLRSHAGVRGALAEFRIDDQPVRGGLQRTRLRRVGHRRPRDWQVRRHESRMGFAAIINDLHKGRDTGRVWSVAIDLVGRGLLVFISLTGLVLLYFVHKYRVAGVILCAAGALASYLVYAIAVP